MDPRSLESQLNRCWTPKSRFKAATYALLSSFKTFKGEFQMYHLSKFSFLLNNWLGLCHSRLLFYNSNLMVPPIVKFFVSVLQESSKVISKYVNVDLPEAASGRRWRRRRVLAAGPKRQWAERAAQVRALGSGLPATKMDEAKVKGKPSIK